MLLINIFVRIIIGCIGLLILVASAAWTVCAFIIEIALTVISLGFKTIFNIKSKEPKP